MKAITLWRPWCWAIVRGHKPVENRDWKPWESLLGARIAIHSGQTYDHSGAGFIDGIIGLNAAPGPERWPGGLIVGTARIEGWVSSNDWRGVPPEAAVELRTSHWFIGEYGWILRDPLAFKEPVPCKGAQGLWTVPPLIEGRVLEQEERAGPRCRSCPHPAHLGLCTKRGGTTAYACSCSAQTPRTAAR